MHSVVGHILQAHESYICYLCMMPLLSDLNPGFLRRYVPFPYGDDLFSPSFFLRPTAMPGQRHQPTPASKTALSGKHPGVPSSTSTSASTGASRLAQGLCGPPPLRPDGKQQLGGEAERRYPQSIQSDSTSFFVCHN